MVVTEAKNFKEVEEKLRKAGVAKVAVVGCGSCATLAGTGGESEVRDVSKKLMENNFTPVFQTVIETACHERLARRELKKIPGNADGILALTCGAGVQNIAGLVDIPVVAGLNTVFIGKTKKPGEFVEFCIACGDCILSETGGICPKARCPKGILNGPCGGMHGGKCEVFLEETCVWVEIYKKLDEENKHKIFRSSFSGFNLRPRKKVKQGEQI